MMPWAALHCQDLQVQDSGDHGPRRALWDQLTTVGIMFPEDQAVVLAPPVLDPSLSSAEQPDVLQQIAGGIGWERFSRESHVAPIDIKLESIRDDAGERIGHLVYVAFVAHVDLDRLRDREQLEAVFGTSAKEASKQTTVQEREQYRAQEVSLEELASRGITEGSADARYLSIRLPLLDRIMVEGWLRVEHTDDEHHVTISWLLDPRFNSLAESQPIHRWWSRENVRDKPSTSDEGQAYQGVGGYLQATRLDHPAGATFIEIRLAMHEPTEWFRGSNLLRSKLPLMIQESVRKFRRQWSE